MHDIWLTNQLLERVYLRQILNVHVVFVEAVIVTDNIYVVVIVVFGIVLVVGVMVVLHNRWLKGG